MFVCRTLDKCLDRLLCDHVMVYMQLTRLLCMEDVQKFTCTADESTNLQV